MSQGCGVRRQPASRVQLASEILEVRVVDASFQVRARVNARRGVTLEIDDIPDLPLFVVAAKEMVEPHLVKRRRRGKCRNVTPNPFFGLVRAHDHRRGIPSDQALDAPLHVRTGPA